MIGTTVTLAVKNVQTLPAAVLSYFLRLFMFDL